jgi:hypothetical protein
LEGLIEIAVRCTVGTVAAVGVPLLSAICISTRAGLHHRDVDAELLSLMSLIRRTVRLSSYILVSRIVMCTVGPQAATTVVLVALRALETRGRVSKDWALAIDMAVDYKLMRVGRGLERSLTGDAFGGMVGGLGCEAGQFDGRQAVSLVRRRPTSLLA